MSDRIKKILEEREDIYTTVEEETEEDSNDAIFVQVSDGFTIDTGNTFSFHTYPQAYVISGDLKVEGEIFAKGNIKYDLDSQKSLVWDGEGWAEIKPASSDYLPKLACALTGAVTAASAIFAYILAF